jgi:hypothetical protein
MTTLTSPKPIDRFVGENGGSDKSLDWRGFVWG